MPQCILVAEDNAGVRESVVYVLEMLGYDVLEAEDGIDALNMLNKSNSEKPDLLITDYAMPRMNGPTLVHAIRASQNWCDLPVIVMSGEPTQERIVLARATGANDFLEKPFRIETLQEKIEAILGKPQEEIPRCNS